MKFILYLVSGFILMYGSYFFYTLYSKSHQSNTNIFEDNFNLKTNKKQNLEFDNFSDTQNFQKNDNLSFETELFPEIDIIKVSPDGSFVIAGKGQPNSNINILNKGDLIDSSIVDSDGNWVVVSKENLKTGDNLISIDQINNNGLVLRHKQLFITKIDEHKKDQPLVISVPNKNSENISIIQQPSEKQKIYKTEEELSISNKKKNNKKIFTVKTIYFDGKGILSLKGIANYGEKIEVFINEQFMDIIFNNEDPNWEYNSEKSLDFGLHNLLVILKSQKNEILDKISIPFMRVEMPSENIPDNFILIKPGDMLWTIAYRIYGDPLKYIQIFEENKEQITNPDLIFPGQLFSIPTKK